MANPHTKIPNAVSRTNTHEGATLSDGAPMNNPLGTNESPLNDNNELSSDDKDSTTEDDDSDQTDNIAANTLGNLPSTDNYDSATQALDDMALLNSESGGDDVYDANVIEDVQEGLTPIHRQNIDDSRIDELLVEDNLDDDDYPTIRDIADNDAVDHSFDDDL